MFGPFATQKKAEALLSGELEARGRERGIVDGGSTTLTTVLLTPVFVVVAFMAFQAALWTHARTEARAVARDAAALVARAGEPASEVARSTEIALDGNDSISGSSVTITTHGSFVTVVVSGSAPGMIRGTSTTFEVSEAVPLEGFRR